MEYRPAEIYPENLDLTVKKWYVFYFFMNPFTGKYERYKVYEDINRQKPDIKIQYAKDLRDAVNRMLHTGYSPWDEERKEQERVRGGEERAKQVAAGNKSSYTIIQGLKHFMASAEGQGLAKSSMARYQSHIRLFKNWLNSRSMLVVSASAITATHLNDFLLESSTQNAWGKHTYNNYLGTLQIVFNHMAKRINGIIPFNPIQGAETKITLSKKHTAYSDQQLQDMLTLVRVANDSYMEGIILSVYYACIRSKAELLKLRAANILYDRDLIRLDAEGTKGRRDDYIPLDPLLKAHFIAKGYDKLPEDWYIFGKLGASAPRPASANFYAERFKTYRDILKLSDRYTLYGFKHTRIIHLAKKSVDPYALIQLTRHTSLDQLMAYLRDLGVTINFDVVKDSRVL